MTLGDWTCMDMLENLNVSKLALRDLTTQTTCVPWFHQIYMWHLVIGRARTY